MVNQPDKKDLIIQSLVNQRNNALNALSDCESNLIIAQQQIAELEAENTELKADKDDCELHRLRAESAEENAATLLSEKEALIAENENLKLALQKLGDEAKAVLVERNELHAAALNIETELNQAKSVLAIKDATIESLQAAKGEE